MTDQNAMSIAQVPVSGGALAVLRRGQGPRTIWLHGWSCDHRMWRPQSALADRWSVIMPDRRGYGHSTAPTALSDEWRDLDALVPEGRVALVGHSAGAVVGFDFARRHPERVSALVLISLPLYDMAAVGGEPDPMRQGNFRDVVRDGRLDELKAGWREHPLMRVKPQARPLRDRMLDEYDGRDLLADPPSVRFALSDIEGLPMPVLAIVGDQDTEWRRACATLVAERAPRGELAVIPNAFHLCSLEAPVAFNETVRTFLNLHHPV